MSRPSNLDELRQLLLKARDEAKPLPRVDLSRMNRVLEHTPEDMTVTVEAGMNYAGMQRQLESSGQWVPLDPPMPESKTVADVLNANWSGPRRFGYGTARDYLLGIRMLLASGELVRAGGKVVKNVAGYDLCRLFLGSRGTLGIPVEATLKLLPCAETERVLQIECPTLVAAGEMIEKVWDSELTPVVLDLHNLWPEGTEAGAGSVCLVIGFAGLSVDVEEQVRMLSAMTPAGPSDLAYEEKFWANGEGGTGRVAVLPSRTIETIATLEVEQFIARAGNGIIYYRPEGDGEALCSAPEWLLRRVKETYDPDNVFGVGVA